MLFAVPSRGDQNEDLFEIHVRPVFVSKCIRCHGPEKAESGLDLTTLDGLLEGGDSGAAIERGQPEASLLIEALRYESFEMPPDGELEKKTIAGIAKWIEGGATWPQGTVLKAGPKISDEDRQWWCYQPIQDPSLPAVSTTHWPRGGIDHFIFAKLAENEIAPADRADMLTLVRRVHFAVTGLPPSKEVCDEARKPGFDYEAFVDRLLGSESYGENQARYWLDLVRYAETDGYRADHARPEAYRYRDYVIKAFNDDKPYDQFIREQIAGDEIAPGNREALTATMYLRHWIYEHNQRDVETQWHEILSDITETTGDVFLAQGLKCARCHDHKFDPILQKDYFRIKAFFAAFQPDEAHPVADVETLAKYHAEYKVWEEATESTRKELRELEQPVLLEHATREGFAKFIPKIKKMIRARPVDRSPYEHQIASLASRQFDLPHDKIEEWLSDEQKEKRKRLREKLAELDSLKPEPLPTMKFVASDIGPIAPATFIPDDETKTEISPGYLTLLDPRNAEIVDVPAALRSTGRRTTLANWIASDANPLTARVIVNRIWQQHFGVGLVDTSSDFGHLGTPPSHPQLLDWLATRFMEDGWSLKKLHRRILLSATYRQTSHRLADENLAKLDPANRLLWKMNPRRLSGEEIHDAIVSASGETKKLKRAIYKPVRRNSRDPLLAAFDGSDRIRSTGKRHRTTTSTQALLLANGSWAHERAEAIRKRFGPSSTDNGVFVQNAYRALFGRQPSTEEVALANEFVSQYEQATPEPKPAKDSLLVQMPGTMGNSIDLDPKRPTSVNIPAADTLPDGDFTVEAVVLLRSLYPDATVRTIVSHWDGDRKHTGWAFGVTSTKSAFKPRNLVFQFVGRKKKGDALQYEVVPSNLRPELNKPYYLAARVKLDDPSTAGVTFYMKDLSDKKAKLQTASAKHSVVRDIRPSNELMVGGRKGKHLWDGLIDSVRIEAAARDLEEPVTQSPEPAEYVVDLQFDSKEQLGQDASTYGNHAEIWYKTNPVITPRERAQTALVHALLNSNELIYVD